MIYNDDRREEKNITKKTLFTDCQVSVSVPAARTEALLTIWLQARTIWMDVSVAVLSFSFLVFYWLQRPPRVPRAVYICTHYC